MSLNKDSKVLFLVSSAVNVVWGNKELVRFAETIGTINSINANFNNAEIWLIDSGFKSIAKRYLEELPKNVKVIDFSKDPTIRKILEDSLIFTKNASKTIVAKDPNIDITPSLKLGYIKNQTECYVFNKVFDEYLIKGYDRVFKISGRYALSPSFNIADHGFTKKYVFYNAIDSNQSTIKGINKMYFCFFWSFCNDIIDDVKLVYKEMQDEMNKRHDSIQIIDIEHLLYNFIDDKNIRHVNKLGIFAKVGESSSVFI